MSIFYNCKALSQIVHIVEEAQASTAKIQRLADSVSAKFVPAVVSVAIASFVVWYLVIGNFVMGLLSFIAVLIIACPCALAIATPAALMVGVGKGAEAGILIRGAEYLERSQKINTVVLDKTGTITKGEPSVTDIVAFNGYSEKEVLLLAAIVESGSEHPLAQAIVRAGRSMKKKEEKEQQQKQEYRQIQNQSRILVQDIITSESPKEFQAISGMGVKAVVRNKLILFGNRKLMDKFRIQRKDIVEQKMVNLESEEKTVMILGINQDIAGLVAVADTLKESSPAAVKTLTYHKTDHYAYTMKTTKTLTTVALILGIASVLSIGATATIANMPKAFATTEEIKKKRRTPHLTRISID